MTIADSFDDHWVEDTPTGCFLWKRGGDAAGYGRLPLNGKQERAHRYAWIRANGPIPLEMHVCHRCDNPQCCNPAHLFLGTNTENRRDSVHKGRAARGERQGNSRLTAEDIARIKDIWWFDHPLQREIAEYFGVNQVHISRIVRGTAWRHLHA